MGVGDIVAMIIIGLSVFGPMLAKWQQKFKGKGLGPAAGSTVSKGEPSTGVRVGRIDSDGRTPSASGGKRQVVRAIERKPRTGGPKARPKPVSAPAPKSSRHIPKTPEAEIKIRHAARDAAREAARKAAPTGMATRDWAIGKPSKRAWTRLQEAVVFREMLGPPKALEGES
jgi:hypothetical protein